jgi:hypothetical protein
MPHQVSGQVCGVESINAHKLSKHGVPAGVGVGFVVGKSAA